MPLPSIPSVCEPVNGRKVAEFFSRYPTAISVGARDVDDGIQEVHNQACEQGSRIWRRARIRHSNPHGNAFAIAHCSAHPERLVLLAAIIEVMWIHDDVTEEFDHATHDRDVEGLLDDVDDRDDDFNRIEEYMPYRVSNYGYCIEERESIREYDVAMGNVLSLTNDYFSWNIEKDQPIDRIRNDVKVLMKEHQPTASIAQKLLLDIIIEEESRAARLKEEQLKKPASKEILLYFEAMELYVGGSCFWHATAPRYRVFE